MYKILPATYRLRELYQQFINISREASKGWRNNNNFGSVYMCVCVCGSGLAISCRRTHTVCVVFGFPVADWMYINRFENKWRDPTFYRLDFPSTLTKKFHPKVFGFSFLKKFVEIVWPFVRTFTVGVIERPGHTEKSDHAIAQTCVTFVLTELMQRFQITSANSG